MIIMKLLVNMLLFLTLTTKLASCYDEMVQFLGMSDLLLISFAILFLSLTSRYFSQMQSWKYFTLHSVFSSTSVVKSHVFEVMTVYCIIGYCFWNNNVDLLICQFMRKHYPLHSYALLYNTTER